MLWKGRDRALILAACAFAYLYVFPIYPALNNPNENVRFFMTAAIVEHGTYRIDEIRERWGWVNDAAAFGGHFFSVKAPATSLLGLPGYAAYFYGAKLANVPLDRNVALWACRLTASILPTLLFLFAFGAWLAKHGGETSRRALLVSIALGSPFFAYAIVFVSHAVAAAAGFYAFMLLFDARRAGSIRRRDAFFAGLCVAGVTALEYHCFFLTLSLSVYALFAVRPVLRRLPLFALGGLVPTLLVMHFQHSAFGNPFTPGHLYMENPAFREVHHTGFYGADQFHAEAAGSLLFDPGYGLLPLTPLLAFAALGFPLLLARRATRVDGVVALTCCALTYLVICFMTNWRGGWTLGARYLVPALPFVAWAAVVGMKAMERAAPRVTAAIASAGVIVGIVASGFLSGYYPHLPEAVERPVGELVPTILLHDFAPANAAGFVDVFGTLSMIPWLVVVALGFAWVFLWKDRPKWTVASALGGLGVGAIAVVLLSLHTTKPAGEAARALVFQSWYPVGHDRAAQITEALAEPSADRERLELELEAVYRAEGRVADADRIERRRLRQLDVRRATPPH